MSLAGCILHASEATGSQESTVAASDCQWHLEAWRSGINLMVLAFSRRRLNREARTRVQLFSLAFLRIILNRATRTRVRIFASTISPKILAIVLISSYSPSILLFLMITLSSFAQDAWMGCIDIRSYGPLVLLCITCHLDLGFALADRRSCVQPPPPSY